MVQTRSKAAAVRNRDLTKTKVAPPKRNAPQPKSKRKSAQLKRMAAAASSEELKRMAALSAVDVDKILRMKKEAFEAMETKCFPLTASADLAAEMARAMLMLAEAEAEAAGQTHEKEKAPESKKKKKVVTYLVPQRYIDHMKAGLFDCVDEIPEEELAKRSELFRGGYHASVLLSEKLRAFLQVLVDQYDAFGYAYDAKEARSNVKRVDYCCS